MNGLPDKKLVGAWELNKGTVKSTSQPGAKKCQFIAYTDELFIVCNNENVSKKGFVSFPKREKFRIFQGIYSMEHRGNRTKQHRGRFTAKSICLSSTTSAASLPEVPDGGETTRDSLSLTVSSRFVLGDVDHECPKVGLTLTRHEEVYVMRGARESGKPFTGKDAGSQRRNQAMKRQTRRKELLIGSKRSCQHTRDSFSASHPDKERKEMFARERATIHNREKTSCQRHPNKENEILLKGKRKGGREESNKTVLSAPWGIPWESPTQVLTGPCAA